MILLVNMGQENGRRNRNEKPQSVEDGERVADSNLCQRGKQHQYRAEQNSHTANRGCRTQYLPKSYDISGMGTQAGV